MRRFNDGMVYTNEKCIGCNKCIRVCPVNGANVSVFENDSSSIMVSSKKCIQCGACVPTCSHGARKFHDDTDDFFRALESDTKVSLLVDPTFYMLNKDEFSGILGYLKYLGVQKIYDVGFGAEISAYAHAKYLRDNKDNPNRAFIANTCSAVTTYVEHYEPDMLGSLVPVQSPTLCTAIYAKRYCDDHNVLALLSPCPAKKAEMQDTANVISYNVCFDNLLRKLKDIDLYSYKGSMDVNSTGIGSLSTVHNGFQDMMELILERDMHVASAEGYDKASVANLKAEALDPEIRPALVCIAGCHNGCYGGAGVNFKKSTAKGLALNIISKNKELAAVLRGKGSAIENFKALEEMLQGLGVNYDDYSREYFNSFRQMSMVPESTYEDIFNAMYKDTPLKRHIDCGSCGYNTCREMAEAIAYGYNKMENCIHYMHDELLMRYYTDALTKIPNSEGFRNDVQYLYDRNPNTQYIIGVISINRLNLINDLHGFSLGDAVIRKAAEICTRFVESCGGCCGRLGGGEFLVCFENTPEALELIGSAYTYSFVDIGVSFPLSFRAGLYIDKDRIESIDTMTNYASLARDRIEEDGISTCLFYNEELRERLAAEAMVTSQMIAAIENGEFVAFYQPQYSHRTKKIVGAETLCRWIKKDGSVISPGLFIPIFEKNGFIKRLDKYMWELAFKSAMEWSEKGYKPIPISVNISRVSLDENDFVDTINDLYEKYPINPELLHFEITESAYSDRQDVVAKKINALRSLGFLVAMDDFGSGYSSLNVLKDMPLDILKLDMGFLRGRNQEKGESIIRNVVAMVKELDLEVVSEGVETMEQAEFLKHVGCDIIQGYLYAKPMPQVEYEELIKN